ncbi:MAG: carboxypeptidase regulatory-like domain-containing protein, partial [Flavobacteriales bacterium]|nr:carboxypeptidase regulatory-like domain-containing protein [Flavobacteriales bacterium]
MNFRPLLLLLLQAASLAVLAQSQATVSGTVRTGDNEVAPDVLITLVGGKTVAQTDDDGKYEIAVPSGTALLLFRQVGMDTTITLTLAPGERRTLDVQLGSRSLATFKRSGERGGGIERLDPKVVVFNPSITGGIESMLSGMGANIRNELSSGYSVRGGNYDENLVYVNDVEVMRPFLVRAGQQEGLSFPNPDMVERIQFSAGGFDARYGDKMSSVLDIQYKRPKKFAATVMASTLGAAVSVESAMLGKRLRQVTGFRYRSTELVLRGLDTKGEYDPRYTDLQS